MGQMTKRRARCGGGRGDRRPLALPWYHRSDYLALLALVTDPEILPQTFDAWLERAEGVEKQLQAAGFAVVRILISPAPFAAWCKQQGMAADQRARHLCH